jgi:hypothetical protein
VNWGLTNGNATHSEVFGNDGGKLGSATGRSACERESPDRRPRERPICQTHSPASSMGRGDCWDRDQVAPWP